ncbi:NAD(+) diphosphatase [Phormidium tenue FACHB-886]|nr:NAD(+) diphosphatase [Phormidium tenue FACHB-886]
MNRIFVPGVALLNSPVEPIGLTWWFAFVGNKLLVEAKTHQIPVLASLTQIGLQPVRSQYLGMLDGQPCYAVELPDDTVPPTGMALLGLRELYPTLGEDLFALAGRAVQIKEWDRTHQYCGYCATPTTQMPDERSKRCPNCGLVSYPRLSPAVIMLISRGEEVLLARSPRFPPGMYSILAGFVEAGESLEETVIREVREEVGIEIANIRYFGSQPWPFPNSLMIGFTATYAGGELAIDLQEIVDAAWFYKHSLPQIPPKPSIARKLLDWFVSS